MRERTRVRADRAPCLQWPKRQPKQRPRQQLGGGLHERESRGRQSVRVVRACAGAVRDSEYAPLNVKVSRQPVKAGPPEGGG